MLILQNANKVGAHKGANVNYCDEAKALFVRLPVQESAYQKNVINYTIKFLIEYGYWGKFDFLYLPFLFANPANMGINLIKNAHNCTKVGAGVIASVANVGVTGSPTACWNTNFTPSIDGVNYKLNDCFFCIDQIGTFSMTGLHGVATPTATTFIGRYTDWKSAANSTAFNPRSVTADVNAIARNSSTLSTFYTPDENLAPYTHAETSTVLPNKPMYLLATNNNGVAAYPCTTTLRMAACGAYLTTSEFLTFKSLIQLARNVSLNGAWNKGFVSFTSSDYTAALMQYGYPIFHAAGIPCCIRSQTDDNTEPVWAQMLSAKQNEGWEMHNHLMTLVKFDVMTDAQIRAGIEGANAAIVAHGFPLPKHFAAPGVIYTEAQLLIVKEYFLSNQKYVYPHGTSLFRDSDMYNWSQLPLDNSGIDLVYVKRYIDWCEAFKVGVNLGFHHVFSDSDPTNSGITVAQLTDVVNYVKSKKLDVITFDASYNKIIEGR